MYCHSIMWDLKFKILIKNKKIPNPSSIDEQVKITHINGMIKSTGYNMYKIYVYRCLHIKCFYDVNSSLHLGDLMLIYACILNPLWFVCFTFANPLRFLGH